MERGGPVRAFWPGHGYTLIELMFVLGLIAAVSGIVAPALLRGLEELRARGAARYISTRLQQTRMEAVVRSTHAALRFTPAGASFTFAAYVDGNGNGVRGPDIQSGVDRRLRSDERLRDQFPGVDFGTLPGLPPVDPSGSPPGADPVRLGASDMVSFTAQGTATPGSLYIRGSGRAQFVVRIFGETGKTRILRFDPRSGTWKPL